MTDLAYGFQTEEIKSQARDHLDLFAGLAMPDDATLDFPEIYQNLWLMVTTALNKTNDFSKFAIGLPRGHGKTMWVKLVILYTILFTDRRFVLIVGAREELATNILSDVADMLDSPNIQAVFGNWRATLDSDVKNFKKFSFNGRPVILAAAGTGTSIRGFNVKNQRPDLIICDDAQTKDCAASVTESRKFMAWFLGTLMKAKSPRGCTYLYVGNMYPDLEIKKGQYACMLRNLQQNSSWTSFIVGALLVDGTALWPELHSREQLLEEFQQDLDMGCPEVFYSEVLNDPQAMSSQLIDLSKIQIHDPPPQDLHQGNFIIIDPANEKKTSDDTAIGYFELYDGMATMRRLLNEKLSGPQIIYRTLELAAQWNCRVVFVESQAYQYSLLGWFQHVCEQLGLQGFEFRPLYTRGISKNARIASMLKELAKGDLRLSSEVYHRVLLQIKKFNPLSKDNEDDILDILAYVEQVIGNHQDILAIAGVAEVLENENFAQLPSPDMFEEYGERNW